MRSLRPLLPLQVLRLSSNNLTVLPAAELAPLAQLALLDLNGNLLQSLPEGLAELTSLTSLRWVWQQ